MKCIGPYSLVSMPWASGIFLYNLRIRIFFFFWWQKQSSNNSRGTFNLRVPLGHMPCGACTSVCHILVALLHEWPPNGTDILVCLWVFYETGVNTLVVHTYRTAVIGHKLFTEPSVSESWLWWNQDMPFNLRQRDLGHDTLLFATLKRTPVPLRDSCS